MPRVPRRPSEGEVYHVFARGVGGQIIFEDDTDRKTLIGIMTKAREYHPVEILAWCFMDNHLHLLLHASLGEVSAFMARALSLYARSFNKRYCRQGHLFQGRFGSEPIDSDAYLLQAVRYIHQNPEKAGIAPTASYRWSSYREYTGAAVIASTSRILGFFESIGRFEAFHRIPSDVKLIECDDGRGEAAAKIALQIAVDELGDSVLNSIRSLPRAERDRSLARLRMRGLTIRQIERITGISRSVIARAAGGTERTVFQVSHFP